MDGISATSAGSSYQGPSRADMLKKFDSNGDGKIDDGERKAAREEMKAKHAGGHHHHHRQADAASSAVAGSNQEAAQTISPPYGADGQMPDQSQPTVDVTV